MIRKNKIILSHELKLIKAIDLIENSGCKNSVFYGGLAQLARAFDWQSRGHRFDSGILHHFFFFSGCVDQRNIPTLMLSYLFAFLRFFILIIAMILFLIPLFLIQLIFGHNASRNFGYRRNYVKLCNAVLGIKIEQDGTAILPETKALFVANHRTLSDPLLICGILDAYVVAKAEVASYPIISTGATATGVLYVNRENKESRTATRNSIYDVVKEGNNVLIFPEGTTSGLPLTKEFHKGSFYKAAEAGIPVIPIAIEYDNPALDYWTGGSLAVQFLNQFGKATTRTKIAFGQPIYSKDGQEILDQAQSFINKKLQQFHTEWNN